MVYSSFTQLTMFLFNGWQHMGQMKPHDINSNIMLKWVTMRYVIFMRLWSLCCYLNPNMTQMTPVCNENLHNFCIYIHTLITTHTHTHKHTHTRLAALCPGLPGWAGTRKMKPIWILLKQETVSDSGICWAICKSAPRSRQITMSAPHRSVFYRPDALPVAQPTVSKHWRQNLNYYFSVNNQSTFLDLLTALGVAHLVVHGTTGSTSYETIPHIRLETPGDMLSTLDMVV